MAFKWLESKRIICSSVPDLLVLGDQFCGRGIFSTGLLGGMIWGWFKHYIYGVLYFIIKTSASLLIIIPEVVTSAESWGLWDGSDGPVVRPMFFLHGAWDPSPWLGNQDPMCRCTYTKKKSTQKKEKYVEIWSLVKVGKTNKITIKNLKRAFSQVSWENSFFFKHRVKDLKTFKHFTVWFDYTDARCGGKLEGLTRICMPLSALITLMSYQN